MTNKETYSSRFYTAKEVAIMLDISVTSAYRIIKDLNDDLKEDGYIVISGRIGKSYLESKIRM